MGKGDQRTRRGKLFRGSYGKTRPGRKKKKKTPRKVVNSESTSRSAESTIPPSGGRTARW